MAVNFPTNDFWMFRLTPDSENSVIIETMKTPSASDLKKLKEMGYRSSGTFTLKTSGTIEQISGPPLVKSWFRSVYSVKANFFEDAPLLVRIKFP
jgi:hypothetical protein